MAITLEELEARVATLEAQQADYRAVISTVNALAVQTRAQFDRVKKQIDGTDAKVEQHRQESSARFNSVDKQFAELKDLIIGLRDR